MSLTQAELDKENDYYMRQASPLHDPDDGTFGDDLEDVVGKRNKKDVILYVPLFIYLIYNQQNNS